MGTYTDIYYFSRCLRRNNKYNIMYGGFGHSKNIANILENYFHIKPLMKEEDLKNEGYLNIKNIEYLYFHNNYNGF